MNRKLYLTIITFVSALFTVPYANALSFTELTCDPIPSTGANSYNVAVACRAGLERAASTGSWYNAYRQSCPSFCVSIGKTNAPSPDGFSCTSGEARPLSAIGKVDYSPTGCWHNCSQPEGSPGAVSVGERCYSPGQKRDNDRTDITVGCYCVGDESVSDTINLGIYSQGAASITGISATPSGWQNACAIQANDIPGRLFSVQGAIAVNTKATLSMRVQVQGQCGSSASINGIISSLYPQVKSGNYEIKLPACVATPTPTPAQTATPTITLQAGVLNFEEFDEYTDISREPVSSAILSTHGVQFSALKGGTFAVARVMQRGEHEPRFKAWLSVLCPGGPNYNRVCNAGNVGKRVLSLTGALNTKDVELKLTLIEPVDKISFDIIDVDGGETWSIIAADKNGVVLSNQKVSFHGYGSCTGNNGATNVKIQANGPQIKSVVIKGTKSIKAFGFAFDNFVIGTPGSSRQCNDSQDNDGDGATDLNDFSCSGSWDNDETNPKSQCQNTTDDDNDGLIDLNDPGCSSAQDNNESDGTSQCQDGKDNDADGATDLSDFSCSGPTDNDEANPKSQCQNTTDDDNDGLIDLNDPGCSSAQDNNESDGTSQCQDGKDNDSDGATDLSDFSCSSPQDNDEANPKSQCQNTIDDDNDGLTDLNDPGCSSAQDNSEEGEAALLTVGVECVTENVDGTKTAYFSYNNTTGANLSVSTNASLRTLNELSMSPSSSQMLTPPTLFKAGLSKGSVAVTFTGTSLKWTVRAPNSSLSAATASATTPVCAVVQPLAECQGFQSGRLRVKVGYRNDNTFEQQFAVGALNSFSPGATDRGQPNRFFAGLNKSVFEVDLFDNQTNQPLSSLTWSVNGITTVLNNKLPVCPDACTDTPIGTINSQLDGIADQMTQVMKKAVKILATSRANLDAQNPRAQAASRGRTDAGRAMKKADKYLTDFKRLTLKLPAVVKTCPEAPPACATVDNGTTIDGLRALYGALRNSTQRTIARSYFRNTGSTNRKDKLVKQAKDLEAQGREALKTLPRFATECK